MIGFQPGDKICIIAGRSYLLRLTIGGLAEISHALKADGPLALACALRANPKDSALTILRIVLRRSNPDMEKISVIEKATQPELITALEQVTALIAEVFGRESSSR